MLRGKGEICGGARSAILINWHLASNGAHIKLPLIAIMVINRSEWGKQRGIAGCKRNYEC